MPQPRPCRSARCSPTTAASSAAPTTIPTNSIWTHGIDHRRTKVRTPKTNGFVERFNGTVLDSSSWTCRETFYDSVEALQADPARMAGPLQHRTAAPRIPQHGPTTSRNCHVVRKPRRLRGQIVPWPQAPQETGLNTLRDTFPEIASWSEVSVEYARCVGQGSKSPAKVKQNSRDSWPRCCAPLAPGRTRLSAWKFSFWTFATHRQPMGCPLRCRRRRTVMQHRTDLRVVERPIERGAPTITPPTHPCRGKQQVAFYGSRAPRCHLDREGPSASPHNPPGSSATRCR